MITVLGKLRDIQSYLDREEYNVLAQRDDWTPQLNHEWLQEAINRGDDILLVSREVSGQYASELNDLIDLMRRRL